MKKCRFNCFVAIFMLIFSSCGATPAFAAYFIQDSSNISYTYNDLEVLLERIDEQQEKIDAAKQIIAAGITLGHSATSEIIIIAQEDLKQAQLLRDEYQDIYTHLNDRWAEKEDEYPVATYLWSYLKDLGYSDYICAGILGNIMAEAGGQTLDIQYDIYNSNESYYGICQWSLEYYPEIQNASLEEQCDFLSQTLKDEFEIFGNNYKKGFSYEDFMALKDVEDVAAAFAKCYERCGSASYIKRQENAVVAYNYFVS